MNREIINRVNKVATLMGVSKSEEDFENIALKWSCDTGNTVDRFYNTLNKLFKEAIPAECLREENLVNYVNINLEP